MASLFHSSVLLRRAAPRLSKEFFTCQFHCRNQARATKFALPTTRSTPFFQSHRLQTTHSVPLASSVLSLSQKAPTSILDGVPSKTSFPKTSHKVVAYWLLGSAASVFGIVVFGGLTRLTESGLSITEWRPVTGSLPPFNKADWDSEFTKYKSSPEFALLNSRMTLEEFKQIYWMEWTHRLWGRVVGLSFVLPTMYFIARRMVAKHMAYKMGGICALIGFQGFIGWWMVASGLKDDLFAPGSHPRVSQYRLATHLGTAFVVYCSMLWCGLSILKERTLLRSPVEGLAKTAVLKNPRLRLFRGAAMAVAALVFTTAMSGALVAGLDAGLIYNEFPWMGLGLTPPKKELWDPFYSHTADHSDLWWRNMLENPSLVQLDHRILATSTFTAVCALFAYPRLASRAGNVVPRDAMKALTGVFHMAWLQVALGISTLIYMVPTWLAATHQAGALMLLTTTVILASRLRISPRTIKLVQEAATATSRKPGPASIKSGVGVAAKTVEQRVA